VNYQIYEPANVCLAPLNFLSSSATARRSPHLLAVIAIDATASSGLRRSRTAAPPPRAATQRSRLVLLLLGTRPSSSNDESARARQQRPGARSSRPGCPGAATHLASASSPWVHDVPTPRPPRIHILCFNTTCGTASDSMRRPPFSSTSARRRPGIALRSLRLGTQPRFGAPPSTSGRSGRDTPSSISWWPWRNAFSSYHRTFWARRIDRRRGGALALTRPTARWIDTTPVALFAL
jgi:hypothetical protein